MLGMLSKAAQSSWVFGSLRLSVQKHSNISAGAQISTEGQLPVSFSKLLPATQTESTQMFWWPEKSKCSKKSFFQQEPTVRRTFVPPGRDKTNCTSCVDRELYLNFTKEEIRKEILRKLDLKEPPNVSVDAVPKHLIKQLLDRYRHDLEDSVNIMNDDPSAHFNGGGHGHFASYEEDDYHFQTRQINMLAQNRK